MSGTSPTAKPNANPNAKPNNNAKQVKVSRSEAEQINKVLDVKITINQSKSYGAVDNSNTYEIDTSDVGAILNEGAKYTGRAELTEEEKKKSCWCFIC